jgi:hypothetical protein
MKLHSIAILLLSSPVCLAQGSRGAARATALKDSSAAAVVAEFRRDTAMFGYGPELIKSAQRAGQRAKADALADSLASMVIATESAKKTREVSMGEFRIATEAVLALKGAGTGEQPYTGAADRFIRIYQESRHGGIFLPLLQVDHDKGAALLKSVAATDDIMALVAVRTLCSAAFLFEISDAGHAAAKAAILDIYDRKLTKYDNPWLTGALVECVQRIRP